MKDNIKEQLILLKTLGDFEVKENQFNELNISNRLESQSVRWILPYESFRDFDYLYIIDIDIFYIREPLALHYQHIEHMEFLGLPFSNISRNYTLTTRSLKPVLSRIKNYGFKNIFNFISSGVITAKKMSGLHFVKIHPYFDIVKNEQNKLKQIIYSKSYKNNFVNNDEVYLFKMIENSGFDMSRIGIQRNSIDMLDFNNPNRAEFRPHHGIHLGIFRSKKHPISFLLILESKEYQYYITVFRTFFKDRLFCDIINMGSKNIKTIIGRVASYYKIDLLI